MDVLVDFEYFRIKGIRVLQGPINIALENGPANSCMVSVWPTLYPRRHQLTLPLGRVLIVSHVDVLDDCVGVYAERLLLILHLFCERPCRFNVTVMLKELEHKPLDEIPLLQRRQARDARCRYIMMEPLLLSLQTVSGPFHPLVRAILGSELAFITESMSKTNGS